MGIVPVVSGGISAAYHISKANRTAPVLTCAGSGASAGTILWWDEPVWVGDAFSIEPLDSDRLDKRFVYHCLKARQTELNETKQGAGIPHVYPSHLIPVEIPCPPIGVQRQIATVLDALENLETRPKASIPVMLSQRRAQLAWYRDRLLAFPPHRLTGITPHMSVKRADRLHSLLGKICKHMLAF